MDSEVDATMNEILKKENVTGAMFVDRNGLAIAGSAQYTSGVIGMLAKTNPLPCCVRGEERDVYLSGENGMTIAIFKKKS